MKIVSWNANGVKPKVSQLINFLAIHKVDIMLINETKLKKEDKLKLKHYTLYRNDRPDNLGAGGVAIAVRHNIPHTRIDINRTTIETLAIKLTDNTHIIAAYNKPLNHFKNNELHTLLNTGRKVLVIGDLNARHVQWNCNRNNTNGNTLAHHINNNNSIIMYPDTHTHYPDNNTTPSTIDLIINKNVTNITNPISMPELNSDHNPITTTLNNQHTEAPHITITSFKNTNWKEFKKTLDTLIKITPNINSADEIERSISTLTEAVKTAKKEHTQKIKINPNKDDLPDEINTLIKQRNALRRNWQRTAQAAVKQEMKEINKEITQKIKQHRERKWTSLLETIKPQDNTLWKLTKSLKKTYTPVPTLETNNALAITDREKANTLVNTFEAIHNTGHNINTQAQIELINTVEKFLETKEAINPNMLAKILTTPREIQEHVRYLPSQKAPGPDEIENKIIKNFPKKTIVQLTYIINAIIKHNYFPDCWKIATVIPIPKPNKNHKIPINYRPISLLNTLAKLTEKIILQRINKIDKKHKITTDCQFGFRPQHNTTQQVARITNDITSNFNKDKVTVMVLMDIQKAFDRVWINGLIYKLIKLKIPNNLIKTIHSYLDNRRIKVKINQNYSEIKTIHAGVPQGSVLGPKLFSLYINDIPQFQKTNTALYADDTAIYAHSFAAEVANRQLQIHINKLTEYYSKWKIDINSEKTEQIIFAKKYTNNKIFTPLKINNTTITPAPTVKYLGVHMDTRLNFKAHIKNTITKAYSALKIVYPIMKNATTIKNKKLIYTAIIRPIITYAAPAWCNISNPTINKLQVYQNKCLRLILNKDRHSRITTLHEEAELETVKEHIYKISQDFYKKQLKHNKLTQQLTAVREHNVNNRIKHKLIYQNLPIYQEVN